MNKPELYVAVFHHEYGVDCFTFCFVPQGKLKHPSPRKVAEHFNVNFEPEKGETFELIPANQSQIATLTAEQIGRETAASADWWHESQEGWIGDDKDEDMEDDTGSNVPCVACGRDDLPLHTNGRCGACGPSPTTNEQTTCGTEIRLPCYGITIRLERDSASGDPGCGTIKSDLKASTDATASPFNAAIDGLEALILAHACAGIDVATPAYVEGIETAVEAIGDHYPSTR